MKNMGGLHYCSSSLHNKEIVTVKHRQSSNHEIEGQMSEPDPSLSDSWKNSRRAELKALQRSSPLILTVYK